MSVVARTQKFLREKFGGVEDDMHEDDEEEDEEQEPMWGGKKNQYYHADNVGYDVIILILFAICPISPNTPSQFLLIYI